MGFITLIEPLIQLAGTGVVAMGIMNWIGGEDGSDSADEVAAEPDGGDQLFDDMGGDEGDDSLDEEGADPFGDAGGDPFGDDVNDEFDDGFGEAGDGGSSVETEEFENRIDELESEVARLSSTVDAVRSENEEIAAGVGETEENVRKLLEVYEVVTRGVNPFDDEAGVGAMDGTGDGDGFGLFDGDGSGQPDDAEPDADVADTGSGNSAADSDENVAETTLVDEADADDEEPVSNGTTFEDLKAEYEDDGVDWADDDGWADDEFEYAQVVDPETVDAHREPYLVTLPDGYLHDLAVLEWVDSLVTQFGAENAAGAIDYYVEIGWLSESVGDHLEAYLDGVVEADVTADSPGPVEMDIEDHVRSLTFITNVAGDVVDQSMIERRVRTRGSPYGLQC